MRTTTAPIATDNTIVERYHSHGVVELQLNRPRSRNAMNTVLYHRLASLLDKHSATVDAASPRGIISDDNHMNTKKRGGTRIIVLTANPTGRTFTAGMDILEANPNPNPNPNNNNNNNSAKNKNHLSDVLQAARTFMHALLRCRCIVIAGVYGAVTGIGVTLMLHCDIVFSTRSASFTTPFYLLGIIPEFASSRFFPRFLGHALTSRLLVQGQTVSADDMHHAGVIQFLDDNENDGGNYNNIGEKVVRYAVKWSEQLNNEQWTSVIKAKQVIRDPLREEAGEAIRKEFEVLLDLERSGVVQRLLASRVSDVQSAASRRRAML